MYYIEVVHNQISNVLKSIILLGAHKFNKIEPLMIFVLLLILMLPLTLIRAVVTNEHFFSSIHLFEYNLINRRDFGYEFIDNVGPLGTFHYPYIFSGNFFYLKMFFAGFICVAFCLLQLKYLSKISSSLLKYALIVLIPLNIYSYNNPWFGYEVIPVLLITLIFLDFGHLIIQKNIPLNSATWLILLLQIFILVLLSLTKFTNLVLICIDFFILLALIVLSRKLQFLFVFPPVFIFLFVGLWIIIGQTLNQILSFFLTRLSLISAYSSTQTIGIPKEQLKYIFVITLLYLFISLAFFWDIYKTTPKSISSLQYVLLSFFIHAAFAITLKHASSRGSSSIGILFSSYLVLITLVLLIRPRTQTYSKIQKTIAFVTISVLLIIAEPIDEFKNRRFAYVEFFSTNFKQEYESEFQSLKKNLLLTPQQKNIIKHFSIDEFGNTPEIILTNDLNYRPRPVPMSTLVGNDDFMNRNADFFRNFQTAPKFIMIENLDYRFEDGKSFLYIQNNYKIVTYIDKWLLLKKNSSDKFNLKDIVQDTSASGNLYKDNFVDTASPRACWTSVEVSQDLFEKLAGLLYKPRVYQLRITWTDGSFTDGKLSWDELVAGFSLVKFQNEAHNVSKLQEEQYAKSFSIVSLTPMPNQLTSSQIKYKLYSCKYSQ